MSALDQKRTYAAQQVMSALAPIATAKSDFRKRSCPLYLRERTCAVQLRMSALGQKRTHAVQQNDTHWCLLDHLVRGAVGSSSAARCTIPRSFGSAKGTALSVRALYFRAVKTTKIGSKRPRKWTTSP